MTDQLPAILDELEREMAEQPARFKLCVDAYKKRLQGYQVTDIADSLQISVGTAYRYIEWAQQNLPAAHRTIDEFIRTSVDRLDVQYSQLEQGRLLGDPIAQRVSAALVDQQAKLLGAYTVKIEHSGQVDYVIDGVDMEQL